MPEQQVQSTLSQMTEEQIAALPKEMQAQVRALLQQNKVLSSLVKEKDPTWVELAHDYGKDSKGVVGVKVSRTGAIQITGTRKAYGGLYVFKKEMQVILANATAIQEWMAKYDAQLTNEKKPKVKDNSKATPPTDTTDVTGAGEGIEETGEDNQEVSQAAQA